MEALLGNPVQFEPFGAHGSHAPLQEGHPLPEFLAAADEPQSQGMRVAGTGVEHLLAKLREERTVDVAGLAGAARGLVLREILKEGLGPIVAIAVDEDAADALETDLSFFLVGSGSRADHPAILRFQNDPLLPYDEFSPDRVLELSRLRTLFLLSQRGLGKAPAVLITTARGLLRRVLPRAVMDASAELLGRGVTIDRDELAAKLIRLGYARVPLVEDPGTFAVRGGVIDIYSPVYERPARLELFGDEVESLRLFDAESQRTISDLVELYLSPAREILFDDTTKARGIAAAREAGDRVNQPSRQVRELTEQISLGHFALGIESLLPGFYDNKLSTLRDYLPPDALYFVEDSEGVQREFHDFEQSLSREYDAAVARAELALPPALHFARPSELLAGQRTLRAHSLFIGDGPLLAMQFGDTQGLRQAILAHHGEEGALSPLIERLTDWRDQGVSTVIACHANGQAERLKRLLLDRRLHVKLYPGPFADVSGSLFDPAIHAHLFTGAVSRGTVASVMKPGSHPIAIVADEEIFGARAAVKTRKQKRAEQPFVAAFRDLNEGDLVVHIEHGIARYGGLTRMSIRGIDGDFLILHYDGADKLYLPVEKLRQVQKFSGQDPAHVRLDKLGSNSWENRKRKVKEFLLQMAAELLDVYAARKAHPGHAFREPDAYYRQFEADFPFEETPDQAHAIADVLSDMQSEKPMDRLVCGDVGFGKTEVALRAAFKAVMDKKQVAILVPTTVLCSQHYRTFRERFKDYPVIVEMLSRLRDVKETKEILQKLREGKIDIVIGTHKLLGKDIAFKDLGLVVVDEEQRFGVTHKEKLKKLRKLVDVLTLTATPIPRTLHMSLAGIRDLSIIATPPEDRRAIRTFVSRFEPLSIKEAIEREIGRGGQVFFVHNRVRSITAMKKFLEELCPKSRFALAHGQMEEHKLDQVMDDFVQRKSDVLLCTSIIESGLDIPTANTIIVNRADTFGLSQLYQIRGRVGRSKERAYCYLLIPRRRPVTKDAQKRLAALQDYTELGSGFRIASHDLEIRGAGNLLGPDQSGQIAAVGFDLYTQLMEDAVRELRGQPPRDEIEPEILLPITALLPEAYLPDVHQRLVFYKRLAQAQSEEDVDEIRGELRDRCGEPPGEVDALTELTGLRIAMRGLRLRTLENGPGRLVVTLGPDAALDPQKLAAKVTRARGEWKLTPDMKLLVAQPRPGDELAAAKKLLHDLSLLAA